MLIAGSRDSLGEASHIALQIHMSHFHRYFVSQVANRIVAVEDKKLVVYEGDYKYVSFLFFFRMHMDPALSQIDLPFPMSLFFSCFRPYTGIIWRRTKK